tara:strand:+ start:894 stop:1145 length:252 start_codon:yes stop_codon:yes gene_type:complete
MERRHIVREIYPNGMPMMIQGELQLDEDCDLFHWAGGGEPTVDPDTCTLHPVIGDKVLPASPIVDTKTRYNIAIRLTDVIREK